MNLPKNLCTWLMSLLVCWVGGFQDERDAVQALDLLYRRVEVRPAYICCPNQTIASGYRPEHRFLLSSQVPNSIR